MDAFNIRFGEINVDGGGQLLHPPLYKFLDVIIMCWSLGRQIPIIIPSGIKKRENKEGGQVQNGPWSMIFECVFSTLPTAAQKILSMKRKDILFWLLLVPIKTVFGRFLWLNLIEIYSIVYSNANYQGLYLYIHLSLQLCISVKCTIGPSWCAPKTASHTFNYKRSPPLPLKRPQQYLGTTRQILQINYYLQTKWAFFPPLHAALLLYLLAISICLALP